MELSSGRRAIHSRVLKEKPCAERETVMNHHLGGRLFTQRVFEEKLCGERE